MQLFVRGLSTNVLECSGTETIGEIKHKIAALENLSCDDISLSVASVPIEDAALTAAFENVTIELNCGLLGGKVHGSLARAGKVKGQTPKVDKQEKKKKKTGRAKRRIQYNRRFVNVVTPFGRRRGPNSNSA
uniref:Ubiquitin/ribosomal protein S30e fusion protein n=1 Tax=Scarabaeus laticollis TaxID=292456 RepID=Q4LAX3_SCALT|nr:ubiquitin/ribosomal protein S30e fusion protein [Scarabaeus laticollis]